jgi:hypothetical protein
MTDTARDSCKYGYASGWGHLLAAADRVSSLAIAAADRDLIHEHLQEVFTALDRLVDESLDDDYDTDTYSDGTPVFVAVQPAGQFPAAATFTADVAPVDLAPGAEVIVELPPHLRDDMAGER